MKTKFTLADGLMWALVLFLLLVGVTGYAPDLSWPWSIEPIDRGSAIGALAIAGVMIVGYTLGKYLKNRNE